ncbi:FAD-binding protein [Nocardia panacis]|uniref:FAD-binding protein n=1 Tax=Nocardia panacis TaxID=2340916 RepID=A0A3A4KA37_9NOCA|nr:BBE domain-containing protein [Nocardia panacis]RJO70073.1 FAD-binding protein [Nocardia panacis]
MTDYLTEDYAADALADSIVVTPGDARYDLLARADNYRFVARPDYFHLVHSADQVERALGAAVAAGKRVTVRSGGHCGEDFVAAPDVEVIIDLSPMSRVGFDPRRNSFFIEPGASIGPALRTLFRNWGVTLPAGFCMGVGAGGHICGGGYGPLSRLFGLTVDYLEAVEVVVVDEHGATATVTATRAEDDPNRDLWWAHTGGGGGNFGVVTRYWLRAPGAEATDPALLLPRPPSTVRIVEVQWPWENLSESAFVRLGTAFQRWQLANSAPDSPNIGLYALLRCMHRSAGHLAMHAQIPDGPDAGRRMDEFLAELACGVPPSVRRQTLPWLAAARYLAVPDTGPWAIAVRRKVKSADLRAAHTPEQLRAAYRHLSNPAYTGPNSSMEYIGYGGRVNTVGPSQTAIPRGAILKTFFMTSWNDPAEDDAHLTWLREIYRDIYAETGGVPVPNEVNTGAYINYPDIDLADPEWNTSGVPWSTLYYGANYPRLQQIKALWDPRNVFRHALSIRPA